MKNSYAALLLLVASVGYEGPVLHRITLADGTTLDAREIVGVDDASLRTGSGETIGLERITVIELSSAMPTTGKVLRNAGCAALAGAVIGFGIGTGIDDQSKMGGPSESAINGCALGAGIGGFAGAVVACGMDPSTYVDLRGVSRHQRRGVIEEYLRRVATRDTSGGESVPE